MVDVQRDSLCRPGQTLVSYQRVLQGGLLVATEELFLKSRCCGSVQLTCPTVSWNCVSLESSQPWEQTQVEENCQLQKPSGAQHHISLQGLCV